MTFTVKDLVHQVRDIVQDKGLSGDYTDPDRHSDAEIIRCANVALADAFRLRPDLFYGNQLVDQELPSVTVDEIATETDFPVHASYFSAFVDHVAGALSLSDDEFSKDGRAVALMQRFSIKLVGVGA